MEWPENLAMALEALTLERVRRMEFTPQERDLIERARLGDDPTPEELLALGPDFIQRLIQRVSMERGQSE
ncbi:MAG: hypothetical protein HYV77_01960 [Candidatus Wildermuthbacteria bacterium]|nr:hypothetical protein [Candidatus Wildermuthbacteria bacterium]